VNEFFTKHLPTSNGARAALALRAYWSAYPESPAARVYGIDAREKASEEFTELRGGRFEIPISRCLI